MTSKIVVNNIESSNSDLTLDSASDLTLASAATNDVKIKSRNVTYTMPTADGTSGQSLTTDGNGTLTWASSVAENSRIFCGAVDFLRDSGVGTSVIISKPASLTASEIRAYEIHFYGVGLTNDVGYNIRFKPYKNGSSVMSGNNFTGIATGNYNGTQYQTAADNFGSYLSFRVYGANYPYRNPAAPIQTYSGTDGYSGKFTGKVVYENNLKSAAYSYRVSVRTGGSGNYMNNEMGSFSAAGSATTTDYAEQFYFYTGSGSFEEGIIAVYAIKK